MSPTSSTSGDTIGGAPLLVGARARAGMEVLAARLAAAGLTTRVFGHPALSPANRNALVAALGALVAAIAGTVRPDWSILGISSVALTAALALGLSLWPRVPAWTVIVGRPGPTTRRLYALALDVRRPQRWRFGVAAVPAVLATVAPGGPIPPLVALVAVAVCAWDRTRARDLSLDAAVAWATARGADPEAVVLVSTAASGHGEGIVAIVDWFGLNTEKLEVHLDEEGSSGAALRLAPLGVVVQR